MQRELKIGGGIAVIVFASLLGLTTYEYYSFASHVARLRTMQQDYHAYLAHLNAVIEQKKDSTSVEDTPVQVAAPTNEESSDESDEDETDEEEEQEFLVVNRSADYLRDSAISYYQEHNLQGATEQLVDAWQPYNDWHLKQQEQKAAAPKKQRKKIKTRQRTNQQVMLRKSNAGPARFSWPIDTAQFWLSSLYGPRKRKDGSYDFHHGLDMAAIKGTKVKAAAPGRVVEARYTAGWGNTILVDHLDGRYKTRYAHLDKIHVYNGQRVTKDTWIGNVGETGRVRKKGKDASHLHFEVYDRGKRVNPLPLLG